MSLRINHNIAALNGHRSMVRNDNAISRSLEKLSSGLRINKAADDAAGLVISEQMRAQITGLNQAIDNSETAVAMVQTAEGALDEVNSLLNKARELVLHAQNEGPNDTAQLAADQAELDNVIQSISRIGQFTQFGTKKLLDGGLAGVSASTNMDYVKVGNLNDNLAAGQVSVAVSSSTRESRTLMSGTVDTNSRVFNAVVTGVNIGSASLNIGASFSLAINGTTVVNHTATALMAGQDIADKINSGLGALPYTASFDGTNIKISSDAIVDFEDFTAALTFNRGASAGTAESMRTIIDSPTGGATAAGQIFVGQATLSGATLNTVVAADTKYTATLTTATGGAASFSISGAAAASTTTFVAGDTLGAVLTKLGAYIASGTSIVGFSGGVTFTVSGGTNAEQLAVTMTRVDDSQTTDFTFTLAIDHNNSAAATATSGTVSLAAAGTYYQGTGAVTAGPVGSATFYDTGTAGQVEAALTSGSEIGANAALRLKINGSEFTYTGGGIGGGRTIETAAAFFQSAIQAMGGTYADVTVSVSGTAGVFSLVDPTGDALGTFSLVVDEDNGLSTTIAGATNVVGVAQGVSLDVASVTGLSSKVAEGVATAAAVTITNTAAQTVSVDGAAGTAVATTSTGGTINLVQSYVADSGEATFTLTTGSQDAGYQDFEFGVDAAFALTGGTATLTLDGGAKFQVGANQGQTVKVAISEVSASALGRTASTKLLNMEDMLSTNKGALINISEYGDDALGVIDQAIDEVTVQRGKLGAFQANTLETGLNSLRVTAENLTAAESTIRDVDFAAESALFTRNSILMQASTAMLAQANQLPQNVLQLLG